jgi:hypothetical protein
MRPYLEKNLHALYAHMNNKRKMKKKNKIKKKIRPYLIHLKKKKKKKKRKKTFTKKGWWSDSRCRP